MAKYKKVTVSSANTRKFIEGVMKVAKLGGVLMENVPVRKGVAMSCSFYIGEDVDVGKDPVVQAYLLEDKDQPAFGKKEPQKPVEPKPVQTKPVQNKPVEPKEEKEPVKEAEGAKEEPVKEAVQKTTKAKKK